MYLHSALLMIQATPEVNSGGGVGSGGSGGEPNLDDLRRQVKVTARTTNKMSPSQPRPSLSSTSIGMAAVGASPRLPHSQQQRQHLQQQRQQQPHPQLQQQSKLEYQQQQSKQG